MIDTDDEMLKEKLKKLDKMQKESGNKGCMINLNMSLNDKVVQTEVMELIKIQTIKEAEKFAKKRIDLDLIKKIVCETLDEIMKGDEIKERINTQFTYFLNKEIQNKIDDVLDSYNIADFIKSKIQIKISSFRGSLEDLDD